MTGVSIVVPVYNALDEARLCVASIYRCRTAMAFEVIVVDNGSTGDVGEWLEQQVRLYPSLRALHFDEPLGFARAINAGARLARYDSLMLLNSDTIVTDRWLDGLAEALVSDASLGIVSPVTNRCGHEVQTDIAARMLEPHEAQRYADSIAGRDGIVREPQRLTFFCVLLRASLWQSLGGLDEAYRSGNFEDDDFCLRARLAGFTLGIVRGVFVFHSERRTFDANRINHADLLARNGSIFLARARSWALEGVVIPGAAPLQDLSVIVPVTATRSAGLGDSLASLARQTVQGFEVIVVHMAGLDVSAAVSEFQARLRLRPIAVGGDALAALLNAGWDAASGVQLAYLPAGDIYLPFHLEVLAQALDDAATEAVFSAWSVVQPGDQRMRREAVQFHDAQPGLTLGDWAPLLCWMHRRLAAPFEAGPFDSSLGNFAGWNFILDRLAPLSPRYLCRVTCERIADAAEARNADDAAEVMRRHPATSAWQRTQQQQFLHAVRQGAWEHTLILARQEILRRARSLLKSAVLPAVNPRSLAALRERLQAATLPLGRPAFERAKPDVLLFSVIAWTGLTQRPHHFARGLVRRGHRVFWVDIHLRRPDQVDSATLLRELEPGILQIEFPGAAETIYQLRWSDDLVETMVVAMAHLRALCGIGAAVQLVNFPRWQPLASALADRFAWPLTYDCLDDQSAFAELYGHDQGEFEAQLIARSAAVLASAQPLLEAVQRPDALLVPNGVDFGLFHHATACGLLDHVAHPIVGFFGAFADWLDLDWVAAAARHFPGWSFVYIGCEGFAQAAARQRWREVTRAANIFVFPQVAPAELACYLAQFDLCVLPFQDLAITRAMNAVKIYEYLAAGKAVVARDLPETRTLAAAGLISVFATQQESFVQMAQAMAAPAPPTTIAQRVAFAAANTWEHRVEQLVAAMGIAEEVAR